MVTQSGSLLLRASGAGRWLLLTLLLTTARILGGIADILTLPVHLVLQKPWRRRWEIQKGSDWHKISTPDCVGVLRETSTSNEVYKQLILENEIDTVDKIWDQAARQYGSKLCLGTRTVLGEEQVTQPDGKVFKKFDLGEYEWTNYRTAHLRSVQFGRGLRRLGLQPGQRIAIYAETRAEWILACLGAFSQNLTVCTLYTNLGAEAVGHGLREVEVGVVITTSALLPALTALLPACPLLNCVIVLDGEAEGTVVSNLQLLSFQEVLQLGDQDDQAAESCAPEPDDLAIIMYTSGSTGTPKGVMISHRNLVATATTILFLRQFDNKNDVYIAYLPLAHVLELLSEVTMLLLGVPIGYSSPNTLTNLSTGVKAGQLGDAVLLRPTIMCTVPLILDRVYKNISEGVTKKGAGFRRVFELCYAYKLWWAEAGWRTPLMDRTVFSKLAAVLGGRVDLMIVGGAPLAPRTQEFVRTCLGARLVQGYTMTETTCSGTCQIPGTTALNSVGGPMAGLEIRLHNWEEGGYRTTDLPHPRGELVVGGQPVSRGYYRNPEKTREDFFMEDGKQFFRSGDIGELRPDGTFRLIDRKKDLVKLQQGEYVSLGKVEAQMKTHPLVDNICVFADSFRSNTIALIVPTKASLLSLAQNCSTQPQGDVSYEEMCANPAVEREVLCALADHGRAAGLERFEIPTAIRLCPQLWLPDSGLVTAAFKLKRRAIQTVFQSSIDQMYSSSY